MKKIIILALLLAICSCNTKTQRIKISSAASLTDVLTSLSKEYTKENGAQFQLNFASSSVCAKQIEKGLQADVFISANPKWSEYLIQKKVVKSKNSKVLLHNSLVVIVPSDSKLIIKNLKDLTLCNKIATGDVSHVPAGIYAKKTLQNVNLFAELQTKITGAVDVRAAMSMVESGSTDCGIVYKTDALVGKNIKIAYEIPAEYTPEITYTICLLNPTEQDFFDFLTSEKAKSIYTKFGFTPAY